MKETTKRYDEPVIELSAMDIWHFVSPLIPVKKDDQLSMDMYLKTYRAFKLLEEEEKNGRNG